MYRIDHYDSIAKNTYKLSGADLLTNGDIEAGSLTGFATTTNWTATASASCDPEGIGGYAVVATANADSILETNKITVTANASYVLSFWFGASGTPRVRLWPNNLTVFIKFYTSGNVFVSQYQLSSNRIKGGDQLNERIKRFTVPASAAKVAIRFFNHHRGGAPDTPGATVIDNIRLVAADQAVTLPLIESLHEGSTDGEQSFSNLKYKNSYRSGFNESTFVVKGSPEYLWAWMRNALGHHIEVYRDAECVFEGLVWEMDGNIAGYNYSYSYDQLFNRITVKYGDKSNTYRIVDRTSIERHGSKQMISDQSEDNLSAAKAKAKSLLVLHSQPLPRIDTADSEEINQITVTCQGYMSTLAWTYLAPRFVGKHDIAEIIADVDIAYGASCLIRVRDDSVNDFISTDYSLVENTGTTSGLLKDVKGKTTMDIINDLLDMGDDDGRVIVCGLTKGRIFYLKSRPNEITYNVVPTEDGNLQFTDLAGAIVPRGLVKSGVFVAFGEPIPSMQSFADVIQQPTAVFVKEVEYDADTDTVRIITPNSDPLDVALSRLFRKKR